jgi:hypothetical protein
VQDVVQILFGDEVDCGVFPGKRALLCSGSNSNTPLWLAARGVLNGRGLQRQVVTHFIDRLTTWAQLRYQRGFFLAKYKTA